ncbi:MAG: hypothetical protein ABSG15_15815, partial [FCB group bacterium]
MINKFIKLSLFFLIGIFSFSTMLSQDLPYSPREIFAFSPRAGIISNYYKANFSNFQGAVDCGLFQKGGGTGAAITLGFEMTIFEKTSLCLGFGYADKGGKFTLESTVPVRDDINSGGVTNVTTDNYLNVTLKYVEISPELRIDVIPDFINGPLRFITGLNFSFPFSNSFTQKENIISPSNAVYKISTTRERDIAAGNIATLNSFNYGISFGLDNLLKIGEHLYFTQEVLYTYNFSNVITDANWKLYSMKYEIGVRYALPMKPKPPKPPPMPEFPIMDTTTIPEIAIIKKDTVIPQPLINVNISEIKGRIYTGNELLATLPLVNAVFFKRGTSSIPEKYISDKLELPSLFYGDGVDIHRYILPRIAQILKNNDKAKMILKGATSGKENESNGLDLAKDRTEAVYNAFVHLGIPKEKLKKDESIFPEYISNQDYDEGKNENQRVDIIVQNAPLQEYVSFQKFAEFNGKVKIDVNFK